MDRRNLRMRNRAGAEVIRQRRPALTYAESRGIESWDYVHDVTNIGCGRCEFVGVVGQSHLKRLLLRNGLMLDLGHVLSFVENIVMSTSRSQKMSKEEKPGVPMGRDDLRPVEQPQHGCTGDWAMMGISWFRVEAAVDLLAR